jgi:Zn-dependent protease with chaperone function
MNDNRLIYEKEKGYFILALLFSITSYIMLIFSIVGIIYIVIGALITLFIHGIMIGNIKNNGVKVNKNQFPQVFQTVESLCRDMQIKEVPEVYVLHSNGVFNAFATRFFGRNFVVLYSEVLELVAMGAEKELNFIIAHELAHIKRKHVARQFLILPALWIPFLGNAYSRACEFTCDRIASVYTRSPEASIRGLTILAIGKVLFEKVNIPDYIEQFNNEKGFFPWLSSVLSTHPPLPIRIKEINNLIQYPQLYGIDPIHFSNEEIPSKIAN